MYIAIGILIGIVGAYLALTIYGIHLRRQNPRYWEKKMRSIRRGPDDVLGTGERVSAVIRDREGRPHYVN